MVNVDAARGPAGSLREQAIAGEGGSSAQRSEAA